MCIRDRCTAIIVYNHMSSSYKCTRICWFMFLLRVFACFLNWSLFVVCLLYVAVFTSVIVCLVSGCSVSLSLQLQLDAWKDSSANDLLCVRRYTILSQSLKPRHNRLCRSKHRASLTLWVFTKLAGDHKSEGMRKSCVRFYRTRIEPAKCVT